MAICKKIFFFILGAVITVMLCALVAVVHMRSIAKAIATTCGNPFVSIWREIFIAIEACNRVPILPHLIISYKESIKG
jgi:H+/gluconate symporter-like permease